MGCNCKPTVINQPKCDNDNCLLIRDLRIGCEDGPHPCGGVDGTLEIDLTTFNDVTASPCDVVYTLLSFDTNVFDSVTMTEQGFLTAITSANFVKQEEFCIAYKVDSPCSLLSDTAEVWVCMKDLCKSKNCENGCNPCDGECIPVEPEIQILDLDPEIKII